MKSSVPFWKPGVSNKLIIAGNACLFIFIAIVLPACNKNAAGNNPKPNPINTQTGPVNIYLAGWRSYYPALEFPMYVKNGVSSDLTNGSGYITANSIAVSGNNVYIGGNQFVNNHFVAKYWTNGSMANLTDTTKDSQLNALAVSGNDVYMAGYENNGSHKIAKYWKNGQSVNLTSGLSDAQITSITVLGNDVYAAGWESSGNFEVAKYWKNGTSVSLSDGSKNTEATSIAISGNDIYVAGNEYTPSNSCPMCGAAPGVVRVSKIWKNGSVIKTANSSQTFNSIVVSNNDLYIAGNDANAASYFKNDAVFHLTTGNSDAVASAIAVWGNDIYVAGYENISGHSVPTYWKNSIPVRLTNGSNNAYLPVIYLSKQL